METFWDVYKKVNGKEVLECPGFTSQAAACEWASGEALKNGIEYVVKQRQVGRLIG